MNENDQISHVPRLLTAYKQFLADQKTAEFVIAVSKHYSLTTLERLARRPQDPKIRRAAILVLGFIGDYSVNHTVGCALQDEDGIVRILAQDSCRSVWNRVGSKIQQGQLTKAIKLNAKGEYHRAIETTSILVGTVPWMGEAWYQQGAAWFKLNFYCKAVDDFHQALEMNPYQFVAAQAMGDAYLILADPVSALESYQRALRLNPSLTVLKDKVAELSRLVDGE